jgi:VWFA-related protein
MKMTAREFVAGLMVGAMVVSQTAALAQQQQAPQVNTPGGGQVAVAQGPDKTYSIKMNANIVLNNVIVRDKKTGEVVKGLKASDFQIFEDKKQQRVSSFDYQEVDKAAVLAEKSTISGKATLADLVENNFAANPQQLRDHRLIVVFMDLSSMQPEDIDRAVDAANNYVDKQMAPADLVALVSMSTGLTMDQDFTSDKDQIKKTLAKYNGTDTTGFAVTDTSGDDTTQFQADDSEYNALNTDRELMAIRAIAKSLEKVDQKKSMLYFSGGLTRQGIENQASLRAATNEAAKANMAIYSVDTRGLQALPPGGDASKASLRGNSAYSGGAMTAQLNANFSSQETLGTLSMDTGGKAFFDSNDFGPAFQAVQHDTEAYYIVGFRSTNQAQDGGYRHLLVKVNRPDVNVQFRPGYYAPADFTHAKTEDRELALNEQLRSDLPASDVAVYLQALYFRLNENSFYVPVSLVVPGSQIPFLKSGNKDKATLDIIGQVKNGQGITVGNARQTVPLVLDPAVNAKQKNIQYSTGFTLAPGKYHLKFVVRENQTGNMGSFETDLNVPDMKKVPLKLSSIVLASQRVPNAQKRVVNPLVRDGVELVPNIPHVFRQDQHLYFLYEVYDPSHPKGEEPLPATGAGMGRRPPLSGIHVETSIEFMLGGVKVYETQPVQAEAINTPDRNAVSFQFDVPLTGLKPGTYVCQVNVIDDTGAAFSFPRMAVRITPGAEAPAVAPASAPVPVKGSGATN